MRISLLVLAICVGLALWALFPSWTAPGSWLLCEPMHPDCISNHWLMVFVAEQLGAGEGILRNNQYYWPVGDAPVLGGNGAEGVSYALLHALLGWPTSAVFYALILLTLAGVGGWVLGRAAGASPWTALIPASVLGCSPYLMGELSAGRMSQVSVVWMLLTIAAGLHLLNKPSQRAAIALGVAGAITAFFYWYYSWFALLALVVVFLVHRLHGKALPWKHLVIAGAIAGVIIAPWAAVFISEWSSIPGTAEAFPPPQAHLDSAWPYVPFLGATHNHLGALPIIPWVIGMIGVVLSLRRGSCAMTRSLVAMWLVFSLLAMGPAFDGAPYTVLYGLAAPLERFWWPVRHVVVVQAALAVLAARVLNRWAGSWGRTACVAIAISSPVSLWLQGQPTHPSMIEIKWPAPGYDELLEQPAGVVVEPPLAPAAAGTQQHLLFQMTHEKPLLSGHALWVDRVRPAEWDAFMASSALLRGMQALERCELSGELRFGPEEIPLLQAQGVRWFVVNRSAFPFSMKPVVQAYHSLFRGLFGEPVIRRQGLSIWDAANWTGRTSIPVPSCTWPQNLVPAGPSHPLTAKRPTDPTFVVKRRNE